MNCQELATASVEGLGTKCFILNNQYLGMVMQVSSFPCVSIASIGCNWFHSFQAALCLAVMQCKCSCACFGLVVACPGGLHLAACCPAGPQQALALATPTQQSFCG